MEWWESGESCGVERVWGRSRELVCGKGGKVSREMDEESQSSHGKLDVEDGL